MIKTYNIYYNLILDCIDNEGYNKKSLLTDKEKLTFLYETFQAEYGWHQKLYKGALTTSLKDWLQGLPSSCSLPYTYYDIEKIIKQVEPNATEKRIDTMQNNYWDFMAMRICEMFKRHKIIK